MDELTRVTTESPIDKQDSNKAVIYNHASKSPAEMGTLTVQPVTAPRLKALEADWVRAGTGQGRE